MPMVPAMAMLAMLSLAAAAAPPHPTHGSPNPPHLTHVLDEMWLRQEPVADAAALKTYRAQLKHVKVTADGSIVADAEQLAQLHTVAEELSEGLTRLLGANVTASCCAPPASGDASAAAGELAVQVTAASRHKLGAEGFTLASIDGDP